MPVPLQELGRETAIVAQAVDYARHASRHGGARIGNAVTHRVAGAYLDGDAALCHEVAYLVRKRHDEAIEISARDVLEVAAGIYAGVQSVLYNGEIAVHRLAASLLELFIYMIVRAAYQDAALAQAQVARELEVLAAGAYPARYLRELIAQLLAHAQGLAVPLAVHEEFRLADDALRPAQLVQVFVKLDYLLRLIRRAALLAVPQDRIRYPDVLRRVRRCQAEIEGAFRHLTVGEHVAVEVPRLSVLEAVFVLALHEDVVFAAELYHAAAPLSKSLQPL